MEDNLLNDIDIRQVVPSDIGFLLKTFTQGLYKIEPNCFVPKSSFFTYQTNILNNFLQNGTQILVANVKDSDDDIMGYLIGDNRIPNLSIVHWIHVKAIFRRMGVAHELLKAFQPLQTELTCTHVCKEFKRYRENHKITYNPYILQGSV